MRISSSTTGKRKSFAPASRRPTAPDASTGRPSRGCPAAPKCAFSRCRTEVPLPHNEKGRSEFFSSTAVVTVALTYPLIFQMGAVLPNDAGDPALNTWILWWNTQTVPFSAAWWNAPAFYPAPGVLSFSENLLGLSLISTPLHWLGVGPQAAYNVVFLLTFPLSALGAYLLGYELTKRHDAAFIAGLLFGFAPYRIAHLPQIQSLASFPMPFALLGLHRYLREPRRPKWLALFAGGLVPAGALQRLLPAVFQRVRRFVDSVVCEPVVAAEAVPRDRSRLGDCRDSDAAAPVALPHDSRLVRLYARFRDHPRLRRRCGRACCTRPITSRSGDGSTSSDAPKGSCFPD